MENEFNWDIIQKGIANKRCVILLGPMLANMPVNGTWSPIEKQLSECIADVLDEKKVEYDKTARSKLEYIAQRFLSIDKANPIDLEELVEGFYNEHTQEIPKEYKAIAELPIECVLNTTPDDYMVRAFEAVGKRPISRYYNFQRPGELDVAKDVRELVASEDRPIVYNLFGSVKDTFSLVLTGDNRLDFIRNIVKGNPPIPQPVRSWFNHGQTYLFLGFNVENWQYLLMLEALKLEPKNKTISPVVRDLVTSIPTRTFFRERFGFMFVEILTEQFIQTLHEKFGHSKPNRVFNIFFAYSDKDKVDLDGLDRFLNPMKKQGEITLWHRGKLKAGEALNKIEIEIRRADIILLLLSVDFLSDNDRDARQELEWALQRRQQEEEVVIVPVVIRYCDWSSYPGLDGLKPLPVKGAPINSPTWNIKDAAYLHIVEELKKIMRKWQW